jgi:hypothetical protein
MLTINYGNNTTLNFGAYGKTECAQFKYDPNVGKIEVKSTYFYAATHPYYFYDRDELN